MNDGMEMDASTGCPTKLHKDEIRYQHYNKVANVAGSRFCDELTRHYNVTMYHSLTL